MVVPKENTLKVSRALHKYIMVKVAESDKFYSADHYLRQKLGLK